MPADTLSIDERNRRLAGPYDGAETNFWFQGRLMAGPHDEDRERRIAWWRDARQMGHVLQLCCAHQGNLLLSVGPAV